MVFLKIRKSLITIIIVLSILSLVSCKQSNDSSNEVSLDFLKTPEKLIIHSGQQLDELNKIEDKANESVKLLNEKYDDISKISEEDLKTQEEINNEVMDVLNSGEVIENKNTIENIFDQLRNLEGNYIDSLDNNIIAKIYLIEDPKTESVVSLDNSYLRMFILLEDGNLVIPKGIMSESETGLNPTGQIEYIKVKLSDKLKDDLEKLANI